MKSSRDVIVIGAGIIGCAIAYRLAKHGLQVTVLEKNQPGREASWAAAGMLAPYAEILHSNPDSLTELLDASHTLYPSFVNELENETGINIGFENTGSVVVAKDYEETKLLAGVMARQRKARKSIQELSAQELREIEPDLAESLQAGLYFHQDHFVNPRRLTTTLVAAATQNSVKFIANTPVLGLQIHKNRVAGVKVPGEVVQGGTIINAAGCWAGMIDSADEIYLPVRPIRGQIVELENRPQSLHHLIHSTGSLCAIKPVDTNSIQPLHPSHPC